MSNTQKLRFSEYQIQELERLYPEQTGIGTLEEMLYRAGQRSVLQHIKEISKVQVRIVPRND